MKKVLFINSTGRTVTGPGKSLIQILEGLHKDKVECHVLLPEKGEVSEWTLNNKINTTIIEYRRLQITKNPFKLLRIFFSYGYKSLKVINYCKKNKIDVIYLNSLSLIPLTILFSFLPSKVKVVWHCREFLKLNKFNTLLLSLSSHFSSKYISVSNALKEHLIKFKVEDNKISVINNGFESNSQTIAVKENIRNHLKINDNDVLMLTVGNLAPGKGNLEFLKAFKECLKKVSTIKAVIVGDILQGDKSYKYELQDYIEKNELSNRVFLVGFKRNTPDYFNSCDIFVQPSMYYDSSPRTVLEAMQAKKPVIATSLGGMKEQVDHEVSGFITQNNTVEELSEYMYKLAINPKLRKEYGQKASMILNSRFSPERHWTSVLSILNKV